jgi:outer membrane protein TolC
MGNADANGIAVHISQRAAQGFISHSGYRDSRRSVISTGPVAGERPAWRCEEVALRQSARVTVAVASKDSAERHRRPRTRRLLALAAGALALGACATYAPAPIDRKAASEAFAARRLDVPALQAAVERVAPTFASPWPPSEWNRATLLAVALAQNPQLAVARAEVEAALAAEVTAGERPNPTLGLQSEYARREPDKWLYGVSFDFLLPRGHVRRLDAEIAALGTSSARTALIEKTWDVRRTLVAAISDRESARRRVDGLEKLASAQDGVVATTRQRITAGEDAPAELAVAESQRFDFAHDLADARATVATADAAVAAALGMPPEALDGVTIAWPEWGTPPPIAGDEISRAKETALLSRSDLASAVDDYSTAEKKLERAVARQYPEIEFHPGYYWDHGIAKWPLDASFALPFNQNRGEIAEATAAREVAGQKMLALQAGIYGAIEAAVRAEAVARANVDNARERADAARKQVGHADVALRLGAGDSLERAAAQSLALRADLDVVQAQAAWQSARNALEDALHAPVSGPELALVRLGGVER